MSDREALLRVLHGAEAAIERSRARIDDLNVYPVPDGDTGTNVALTVRAVVEAVEGSAAEDRATLAAETTRAALMGARGNSGVILSQIVRGLADVLGRDGAALAEALRSGSDAAYRAVRDPVEGTMLTAIRVLAETAETAPEQPLAELLATLVERGERAVEQTPAQLDVLQEAGVVDAGAAALVELLRGAAAGLAGEEVSGPAAVVLQPPTEPAHEQPSRYRYCTAFVVEGELDPAAIEGAVEPLGDSLLVVGDEHTLKVHVHTDEPGAALAVGTAAGAIGNVEIADMHRQTEARNRRLAAVPDPPRAAAIAVAVGEGNRRLLESLGAVVVEGGQTMNPSAAELVAAAEAAPAPEVVLLPNNDNVVLAAQQAAQLAKKDVQVVPTQSLQAGLAALVAFDPTRPAEENLAAMAEAVGRVSTGAVTTASRSVQLNGRAVGAGEYLGLVGDEPVAGGSEFDAVARIVLERLLKGSPEVLTLLTGDEAPDVGTLVAELERLHPELEIELHEGGQPHYPLLVSAE